MNKPDIEQRSATLRALADELDGHELVPGFSLPPPRFGKPWSILEIRTIEGRLGDIPNDFRAFVMSTGGVAAIDTAGGVAFMSAKQVLDHLSQEYGPLLASVGGGSSFPFATNGAGSYFVLAITDAGVWKYNVHMAPVATPERIAGSFGAFLDVVADDWRAVVAGRGGPYKTG